VRILKAQYVVLETFVSDELKLSQTKASGNAAATAYILYDPTAPHWSKVRDAMGTAPCTVQAPNLGHRKMCIDAMMAAAGKPLTEALDAADKFDIAMSRENPPAKDRLSAQLETLQKIARGEQVTEGHLKAVWESAMRYIALFQSAGEAVSTENKKKITDAWAAFEKALKE
jgi:hypothetical protein